jgi:hypothetical protein
MVFGRQPITEGAEHSGPAFEDLQRNCGRRYRSSAFNGLDVCRKTPLALRSFAKSFESTKNPVASRLARARGSYVLGGSRTRKASVLERLQFAALAETVQLSAVGD